MQHTKKKKAHTCTQKKHITNIETHTSYQTTAGGGRWDKKK